MWQKVINCVIELHVVYADPLIEVDMKIYKIYKIKPSVEYDYYNDDFVETTELEEIKYVDSIEKVNNFLSNIQENNKSCEVDNNIYEYEEIEVE